MTVLHKKLGTRGRLQIPADIRRAMGIRDGTAVEMEVKDGELFIPPVREKPLSNRNS